MALGHFHPVNIFSSFKIITNTNFSLGHSSSSFALLSYLSFYLSGKLGVFNTKGHTTKVWIAYTPMLGAALIAVSRSMDYRE